MNSQGVNGGNHGVDPNIEFVSVNKKGIVNKLLHKSGSGGFQIQIFQFFNFDPTMIRVLLHKHFLRVVFGVI